MIARASIVMVVVMTLTACDTSRVSDRTTTVESGIDVSRKAPALCWAPPSWTETKYVDTSGYLETLNNNTDYLVVLPGSTVTGSVDVRGGRNITIIGGEIKINTNDTAALAFIRNGTMRYRTVHVEGVNIDMSNAGLVGADAIVLRDKKATFHFQNMRMTGLAADPIWHGDAIQNQSGARFVGVYRATVTTDWQGFTLPVYSESEGPLRRVELQYVDFSRANVGPDPENPNYLMMTQCIEGEAECGDDYCVTWPDGSYLNEVYVEPDPYGFPESLYPTFRVPSQCPGDSLSNPLRIQWPALSSEGAVMPGLVSPFVPANIAGIDYESPGYLEDCAAGGIEP